ncbi:DUF5959 family protein [Streptomyces sp. NPDC057074]|uniref:DUF5959 family protein n=1 Tax=Streptomyces sp. NPDC057074 TaxID=3346015 RepID=UPI003643D19F
MVDSAQRLKLFRFTDTAQSVIVRRRCDAPLAMDEERYYSAEIVAQSDLLGGRVGLQASRQDLDEWEHCLDALQAEAGVEWRT